MVGGLHLLCRSYILPLAKKRRETVLFLPRKESAYRTQRPSTLESPLPLYTNEIFKKFILFKATTATSACTSPGLKNSPLCIQSLPEHGLRLNRIGRIFWAKELLKQSLLLAENPLRRGLTQERKKKKKREREKREKGKQKREKERKIIGIRRILQIKKCFSCGQMGQFCWQCPAKQRQKATPINPRT